MPGKKELLQMYLMSRSATAIAAIQITNYVSYSEMLQAGKKL